MEAPASIPEQIQGTEAGSALTSHTKGMEGPASIPEQLQVTDATAVLRSHTQDAPIISEHAQFDAGVGHFKLSPLESMHQGTDEPETAEEDGLLTSIIKNISALFGFGAENDDEIEANFAICRCSEEPVFSDEPVNDCLRPERWEDYGHPRYLENLTLKFEQINVELLKMKLEGLIVKEEGCMPPEQCEMALCKMPAEATAHARDALRILLRSLQFDPE